MFLRARRPLPRWTNTATLLESRLMYNIFVTRPFIRLFVCLLLVGTVLLGQPRPRTVAIAPGAASPPMFADFDVRWRAQNDAKPPASERNTATRSAGEDGLEVQWNEFGLARMVRRADGPLTARAGGEGSATIARRFLADRPGYFRLDATTTRELQVLRETSRGGIRLVDFRQMVDGVPVFGADVRVALDAEGRVIQAGAGDLAPELRAVEEPRLSGADAVARALALMRLEESASVNTRRVERVVFPLSAAAGRPGYRVILDTGSGGLYDLVVDAASGALLYRRSLIDDAAKGRVWTKSPIAGEREMMDFGLGWLPADRTLTAGNNADAYLDWDGDLEPDLLDGPDIQAGRAMSASQVFDFPAGEGSRGMDPSDYPAAAITNAFYQVNQAHNYYYRLGFDEPSGNFQDNNYNRGGEGGDAVPVAVHSPEAENNAFFGTTPEGMPPIMALGIVTQYNDDPTDDRSTALSAQVIFHEYGHGVTKRLISGPQIADCLNGVQSDGMSEGWSDYFAISHTNDPVLGAYFLGNLEHGIRRQSYEGYSNTYENIANGAFLDPHADGEIWAAALWDLRRKLGQQTTDQLVMDGVRLTQCRPSMVDARDAILRADDVINDRAHWPEIWASFAHFGMGASASGQDGAQFSASVFNAAYDVPGEAWSGNSNPVVGSVPPMGSGVGQPYVYQIKASDADGDPLSYELLDGPEGMSIDPDIGLLQGTGSFLSERASIRISDGAGGEVVHGFTIPMLTELAPGVPAMITGGFYTDGFAGIDVPPGKEVLQVTLRGGHGRTVLGLRSPFGDERGSSVSGQNHTLTVVTPDAGSWGIQVAGLTSYSGVALEASFPEPREIPVNEVVGGLAGESTSETYFRVAVPEGTGHLRIRTSGGPGDADLLVRRLGIASCPMASAVFSDCLVDATSTRSSNTEQIDISQPPAGEWNITLAGYQAYSDVTLLVESFPAGALLPEIGGIVLATGTPLTYRVSPLAMATIHGRDFVPAGVEALQPRLNAEGRVETELAHTCVEINGIRAPVLAVTPTQVNIQVPEDVAPGTAEVVVIAGCGTDDELSSAPVTVKVAEVTPGFFSFVNTASGANPIAALHGSGPGLVGAPGLIAGTATTPAAPGEYVSLFGTGFGATDPPLAAGEIPAAILGDTDGQARCINPLTIRIGDSTVPGEDIYYAGVAPCCAGLYQFIVKVPEATPSGDIAVSATVGGKSTSPGPYITVK